MRTHKIPLEELDAASTGALIEEMAESIASLLKGLDSEGELRVARGVDVGYIGQSYQVTVPLDGAVDRETIWERFATLYREKYGYFYDDVPAEIVNLRVLGELVGGELGLEPLPVEPGAAAVAAGTRLALFGSVLRDDFGPDSDVDVLVEFEPERIPGLLGVAAMEIALSDLFGGRKVDLRTLDDLSRYFRQEVLDAAEVRYGEG